MKRNTKKQRTETLSPLEHVVMEFLWKQSRSSAEDVRRGLAERWPMKDSTARTILRRLEAKGFLRHTVEGRTYFYESAEAPESVAVRAVRRIADRFFQGSVENLVVGMIENEVIGPEQLERLARRTARPKGGKK